MTLVVLRPLHVRRSNGDLHLKPGLPVELPDGDALRLLTKKPDAVRPVLQAGNWVEWLSPALPPQQGEVLAVHPDGTFEVYHPLAEALCRLPITWVKRVVKDATQSSLSGGSDVAAARIALTKRPTMVQLPTSWAQYGRDYDGL